MKVPDVQKETSDHNGSKYHNSVKSTSNKPATSTNQNYHSDEVDLSNSWETSFMGEELKKVRDDTYNSIVHGSGSNHGQSYGSKNSTSSFSNTIKSFGNELNNGFWTDIDMINGFRSGFVQGGINVGQTWVAFGKGVINGNVGSVFGSMGQGIMDFGPNFKNANLIGKSYLTGEAISTVGFGLMSAYVAVALPYTEAVPMIKGAAKLMSKAGFFGKSNRGIVNNTNKLVSEEQSYPSGSIGAGRTWTTKARIKAAQLPNEGKIRFVPRKNYQPSMSLPKGENKGYIDKFGNEWTKGPSRTMEQNFEWDVQLSPLGQKQLGWLSRDLKHINVSLDGKVTHW